MSEARQRRPERRSDALTRTRIVDAAIVILDGGGTEALTFRALAVSLATGAGALYHHVANKDELLAAAAAATMTEVLQGAGGSTPEERIRAVTSSVFDAIRERPWLGTQLVAAPWQPAVLQLFDRVGSELAAVGVPQRSQLNAASALVHHLLGVASQYDATGQLAGIEMSRPEFIGAAMSPLVGCGDAQHPFLTRIAKELTDHDDRDQFQAGVEIILSGIEVLRQELPDGQHVSAQGVGPG